MSTDTVKTKADGAESLSTDGLASSLPWHIGFHNEIADMLRPTGDWNPDMVRYRVVQVCDHDGRHVCWAKSPEHAALIVEAINKMANVEFSGTTAASSPEAPLERRVGPDAQED